MENAPLRVSQFLEYCNDLLTMNFEEVVIEGEVMSFKVNQGKWVFFDLKDDESSVGCFMTLWQMTQPIADGMKVRVRATPKLTKWGKFSLTVRQVVPVGEGSLKKSFEMLKKKLEKEGLFAVERKRPLPEKITKIGVVSSTGAAGYKDFLKILENRWGGLKIQTVNTQVQGMAAPAQMVKALRFLNERNEVDVIAILRGGGSADDLSAFNDEELVRAIAASKIPVITGIGHEVDESLADYAADVRASTPSNAAERLTPDRGAVARRVRMQAEEIRRFLLEKIAGMRRENREMIGRARQEVARRIELAERSVQEKRRMLESFNPEAVLRRGYAIVRGEVVRGEEIEILRSEEIIKAEVKDVTKR